MPKFAVKIKSGKPGEYKNSSHDVTVEADDESTALILAVNKLKNSNPSYRDKEFDVVKITRK